MFFPIQKTYDEPFKIYHSVIDLGFEDYGVFSVLVVVLLSFTVTIYTNDKNLKVTKFTILPDEYLTFTVKIDNILQFHNAKRNFENYDNIETLLNYFYKWLFIMIKIKYSIYNLVKLKNRFIWKVILIIIISPV